MQKFSYLNSTNAGYIDELYTSYLKNPESVDPTWRYFFEGSELTALGEAIHPQGTDALSKQDPKQAQNQTFSVDFSAEAKVAELVMAYRELGRLLANLNPLAPPATSHPLLELSRFGLSQSDLSKTFAAGRLLGIGSAKLQEILSKLHRTYCGAVGVEFTHIQNLAERDWLQKRMESSDNREDLDSDTKKFILKRLTDSETFERFLHTRYVAQKRFSIEGGEGLVPSLDCMIECGAELGAEEFVMGMAHRGRLNVLTNVFGKKPEYIFAEFEGIGKTDTSDSEGDVKYHMGYSADFTTRKGKNVHLSLASNPSHLEFVDPVIEGVARAKQAYRDDAERRKVIPILIHGDASFAGQGVCYETLNLSLLPGYTTGGTLHIIVNNQVGFTTSPEEARSTTYSTDLAKMLEVPIFHVNGDDPEAIWYVSKVCSEYRQKFKKDVFIDLICYRKHGHNEGDEPAFTQPLLYKKIKAHSSPREIYADKLARESTISATEAQAIQDGVNAKLTEAQIITRTQLTKPFVSVFEGSWKGFKRPNKEDLFQPVKTGVPEAELKELAESINKFPATFRVHPKLNRFFEARLRAVVEGKGLDWGNGEALAYASLLKEGKNVRLSGQDAQRGTFSHRHAVLHDFETGELYTPLSQALNPKEKQGNFEVYNSHLSETGVLGFEYGYSLADPHTLVMWEAQFGDFANSAQVIIDQFIASSESKWQRMSGLTLLLPHGFEGQGPEHSSARLERFLQLCGKNNMIVCNFTTPAQLFHALRRQMVREFRKPLVVMTPKSLLRHPLAVSDLKDFTKDTYFREVLDDPEIKTDGERSKIQRVILCSGKVYYDLVEHRAAKKIGNIAIVRLEQLYPWPAALLTEVLNRYENAASILWVQEEPRNMGGWSYVFGVWEGGLDDPFRRKVKDRSIEYVGRDVCAAPAVGSHKIHETEQDTLIQKALSL